MRISGTEIYNNNPKQAITLHNGAQDKSPFSSNGNSFKGGVGDTVFNVLDKAFSVLDKNAMIQVSFVDTVSTNIPRTLVDLKTGLAASLETCRREFSGLFVNCLMPGLIVKALADIMPKSGDLKKTNAAGSWANGDAIDKLKEVYTQAQTAGVADATKEFVKTAITSLSGLEGKTWVDYASKAQDPVFISAIDDVTAAVSKTGKERGQLLKSAREKLAGLTKAESILQFNGKPQANLEETLRDIADLGSKFNTIKDTTAKSMDKTAETLTNKELETAINAYSDKLKSFVNKKSIIGLGIVIAIAVSVQTINRAITRKQFSAAGAPIYKEFGKKDTTQKMDEEQKKKFRLKKAASAASMYGLAALSMMKKPTLGMFQFSGIFPTLDQCRWVAASTFASRMLGAEDENELRETTVRDLASFAGLYFLGDYAKKGAASAIEALSKTSKGKKLFGEEIVLLNRKKEVIAENGAGLIQQAKYRFKQFGNWIKNTELKSASEVSSIKVRNLRNICRVADIAFSVVMLGILLPKYNRKVTERKVAEAKKREEEQKRAMLDFSLIEKNSTPSVFKNILK